MTSLPLSAAAGEPGVLSRARALTLERLAVPLLLVLALAASATSLGNGFAYDDKWIILGNTRIHSLAAWWEFFGQSYWPPAMHAALYRPLTILAFAIQWQVGGGEPWPFHLVNVLLYVAVTVLLYRFARELMPTLAAWIAAAIFAVHPVHVEAVGNGVGQSELWVAAVILVAMTCYARWRRDGDLSWRRRVALASLYAVACLFKENGIVLIALLGALEATVVQDARGWRARAAALRPVYAELVLVALCALLVRFLVLGSVGGDVPHPVWMEFTTGERLLTVVGTLVPEWARLLVWPARLLADYSPLDLPVHRTASLALLPGAVILAGLLVLLAVAWRRAPVVALGLLLLLVTMAPVSNLLFASGVMLAERTLLLPSAGFVLVLGALVPGLLVSLEKRAIRIAAAGTLGALLLAGAVHSAERQRTWKSTTEVFLNLIADAPLNYRAHYGWGSELMARRLFAQGEREWRIAIGLYPTYGGVKFDLAKSYSDNRMFAAAVPLYREVLKTTPHRADARAKLVWCLLQLQAYGDARDQAIRGMEWGNSPNTFRILLARAYRGLRAQPGGMSAPALPDVRYAAARALASEQAQPFARPLVSTDEYADGAGDTVRAATRTGSGRMQRAVQNTR